MRLAFLSLFVAPLITVVAGAALTPEALAVIIIGQTKPMCSRDGLPCVTNRYCCNHNCSGGYCRPPKDELSGLTPIGQSMCSDIGQFCDAYYPCCPGSSCGDHLCA
ncbi:hypothetical protein V8B97DRAFT_1917968 [Scleroderma yunnanense]